MKNKLVISLKDNPQLQEFFTKKGVGNECTLEVTASLDDMGPDMATLSVSEVEAYDEVETPESTETDGSETAMADTASVMEAFKK